MGNKCVPAQQLPYLEHVASRDAVGAELVQLDHAAERDQTDERVRRQQREGGLQGESICCLMIIDCHAMMRLRYLNLRFVASIC